MLNLRDFHLSTEPGKKIKRSEQIYSDRTYDLPA